MKYTNFMELSAEIKVEIIRKCYPISYVRLRRACRDLDEISERNRKWLGIYCYRKEPHIYLTDTLAISPFKTTQEDLSGAHVVVNYGKKEGDHNFLVPMTLENISKIRQSLSGFYFFEIKLMNSASYDDTEKNKKYNVALTYFLEITADFNIKYVSVQNLTTLQIEIVLRTWKTQGIRATTTRDTTSSHLKQIAEMDTVKKMTYGYYHASNALTDITDQLIQEMALGKKTVYLFLDHLPDQIALKAYNHLHKIWKETRFPSYFSISMVHHHSFFYQYQGYSVSLCIHVIGLRDLHLTFKGNRSSKRDIWIAEIKNQNEWQVVELKRTLRGTVTNVNACLQSFSSKEALITKLYDLLNDAYPGNACDYSVLFGHMEKLKTMEEIKDEYSKTAETMLRFYTKVYRRSILNVLCEIVMEWWNGPRWILELTKRKPIERRSPFVDLGYVLFQELLCPIYQYCTVPNI